MEYVSGRKDRPPIDKGWARELAQACAELELPHDTPTGCGIKAVAIMSFLRLQGVPRDDIHATLAYVPDFSAEGITAAETEKRAMCFQQSSRTFAERLKTGIGVVDTDANAVEWRDVRMAETEKDGNTYVKVERLAPVAERAIRAGSHLANLLNRNTWMLSPPGQNIYMCNHTAAGLGDDTVIDPGYKKDGPLSIEEWRECTEFPGAVLLSSMPAGSAVPFSAHADLMLPDQRRRYDALLAKNGVTLETVRGNLPAYQAVMTEFMNLGNSVPWQDDPSATIAQRVSWSNAETMLAGNKAYELRPDEECKERLDSMIAQLALAMTYQRWLEETETVPLRA